MKKKLSKKVFQLNEIERQRLTDLREHFGLKTEAETVRLSLKKTANSEGLK